MAPILFMNIRSNCNFSPKCVNETTVELNKFTANERADPTEEKNQDCSINNDKQKKKKRQKKLLINNEILFLSRE